MDYGDWFASTVPNPRDVWKSSDDLHWAKVIDEAAWEKSDLPLGLVFKDRMWQMGGRSLPGTACSNEVWATTDGAHWDLITPQAQWSPRLGSARAVFNGRMWLFGGTTNFYESNPDTLRHDIWSSADGVTWTCHCEQAAWSPRAYTKVVELNGRLWLIGGGSFGDMQVPRNDVWYSDDGIGQWR